jgi:outer membrane protein OmpA-like peptidoglycan-associated protein/tetratricopeptide (TPR) repeat protein
MKRKLFLFSLLFCIVAGYSQQKLKKADRLFADLAYVDAAQQYEEYLKGENEPGTQTVMNVADAYYYTGNMGSALRWYTKLDEILAGSMDDKYFNRYLQTLRAEENYKKADELLKKRLEAKGDEAVIAKFISQKKYLDSLNGTTSNYTVTNLASNSNKADFGTAFYGTQIVYSSSKDTTKIAKLYTWNDQPYLQLFVADRNATDGSFFNEKKFIPDEQTQYHNATLAFMPDLKTVFYSANTVKKNDKLNNSKNGTNNIEIIKGKVAGDKLSDAQGLPFNSKDYSVGHPALTADGKWLFFVSDMPGGYGDTDVYVAEVFSDGKVGAAKNLGATINTAGREMFPFVNDSILYFSSDGHYGLGGLDVFESRRVKDFEFSAPLNLGRPVNSNLDDFAFIIDKEKKFGYFSSSRTGGKGDDDIYYFTRVDPPCTQWVSGKVTNMKYKMGINQADVKVYDQYGDVIGSVKTAEDGTYKVEVPCNSKIKVEASKINHNKDNKELQTNKTNGEETKDVDFVLSNYDDLVKKENGVEKVDINPIYFEFNKWAITTQAAEELDKVVYIMKNFPGIVIKIESHTDSRGKDEYNLKLSEERAKSTYEYILARGIEPSRIESVKGYGETQLMNKCSNGVKCTDEEHAINRRSDFIIVKK